MRCIFCRSDAGPFNGREHVMPQFLGTFAPENLLLDEVCDSCNGSFGRSFEEVFKRDSIEGLLAAQFCLRNRSEIIIRGERIKFLGDRSTSDSIFQDLFPFLDKSSGMAVPHDHVIFELDSGSRHILRADHPKFGDRLKRLSGRRTNVSIFAHSRERLLEIQRQLGENGIKYQPQVEREITDADLTVIFERKLEQRIDSTLCRLPAKLAFNYFAWSLRKKCGIEGVYDDCFDHVRNFILRGDGSSPVSVSDDILASTDGTVAPASPIHMVVWRKDNGTLIGEVALFALLRYTVVLGQVPTKASIPEGNGYGHVFDLNERTIRELVVEIGAPPAVSKSRSPSKWGIEVLPP